MREIVGAMLIVVVSMLGVLLIVKGLIGLFLWWGG